jgi:hypothetical protein
MCRNSTREARVGSARSLHEVLRDAIAPEPHLPEWHERSCVDETRSCRLATNRFVAC